MTFAFMSFCMMWIPFFSKSNTSFLNANAIWEIDSFMEKRFTIGKRDNEGDYDEFEAVVEKYHERFGYYPERILADKIYRSRKNRE